VKLIGSNLPLHNDIDWTMRLRIAHLIDTVPKDQRLS
jgi:hypothetical protein